MFCTESKRFVYRNPITINGPTGTAFQEEGLAGFSQPEDIIAVGETGAKAEKVIRETTIDYIEAGAQRHIATIPTLAARKFLHEQDGEQIYEAILKRACDIVVSTIDGIQELSKRQIELAISFITANDCYDPSVSLKRSAAREFHDKQIAAAVGLAKKYGRKIVPLFETNPCPEEAAGIAEAAANRGVPIRISWTPDVNGDVYGVPVAEAIRIVDEAGQGYVLGHLFNCHQQGTDVLAVEKVRKSDPQLVQRIIGAYANGAEEGHAADFEGSSEIVGIQNLSGAAEQIYQFAQQLEVNEVIVGGCCATNADLLRAINETFAQPGQVRNVELSTPAKGLHGVINPVAKKNHNGHVCNTGCKHNH